MEYGITLTLIIAITGGIIAYLGDTIGSKIGKKRIRLFGMRPHKSSIVITVLTGIFIAGATIGVSALLSNHVRTALFGMGKLEARMAELNREVNEKSAALTKGQALLGQKSKELLDLQGQIDSVHERLEQAEIARNIAIGKLETATTAYRAAEAKLAKSQEEIADLEMTKQRLDDNVRSLELIKTRLENTVVQLREGDVLFRIGEVLAGAVVNPGLNEQEYEYTLARILNDTNQLVLERLKTDKQDTMILVSPDNLKHVATQLTEAKGPSLVRVIAAGNVVYGEPIVVTLAVQPYNEIYERGQVVYTETVKGGSGAEATVLNFLHTVNQKAQVAGVLPNPLTGQVGSLDGSELYATIDQVRRQTGSLRLEAIAKDTIYTEGPLVISIRVIPVP